MEQDSRKYIASIVFFRKFITVFFSIFFNVYILKIVNNDLNFIILLIIEAIIVVSIAIKIKDFTVSNKKLELKKFWKKVKDKKFMKDIYKCMFYRRISTQGAVKELLPIILFLR